MSRKAMRVYGAVTLCSGDWRPGEIAAAEKYWPSRYDEPRFERRIDGALIADHSFRGACVEVVRPAVPVRVVRGKRS